jgi:hypothetical protein
MVSEELQLSIDEPAEQVLVESEGDTDSMVYALGTDEELIGLEIMASSSGSETSDADSENTEEDDEDASESDSDSEQSTPDTITSIFSIEYLKGLRTPMPSGTAITIALGADLPVTLAFDLADATGHVQYLIAPRTEHSGASIRTQRTNCFLGTSALPRSQNALTGLSHYLAI